MKINNFRGDVTDNSAKKEALDVMAHRNDAICEHRVMMATFWATKCCNFSSRSITGSGKGCYKARRIGAHQCCRSSQNISYVTPKINLFYHQPKIVTRSKCPKIQRCIFEKNFTGAHRYQQHSLSDTHWCCCSQYVGLVTKNILLSKIISVGSKYP